MNARNFTQVLADVREVRADEAEIARINAMVRVAESQELARQMKCQDFMNQRAAKALPRRFTGEPPTGWGALPVFHDEDTEPTPAERAADDYQDSRITRDKEQRHFGSNE